MRWDVGHPHSVHKVRTEEQILEVNERQRLFSACRPFPCFCTQCVARTAVWYLHRIQTLQEVLPHDAPARHNSANQFFQQSAEDVTFTEEVLFKDESCFERTGFTFAANMCGQMQMVRFYSFPSTCRLAFQMTAS
jgi:hypothetical protein